MKIVSLNPATEETNKEFEALSKKDALAAAKASRTAFAAWSTLDVAERAGHLKQLASVLRKNASEYAHLITIEMGKPIKDAQSEIEKCAWTAEYYADNAERFVAEELVQTDAAKSYVSFAPLGTILSIMPWNFPFWQALRFGLPALAAGNAVLLRHSNVVPQCSLAIASAFREAGFPDHVFASVLTDHDTVKALIRSPAIAAVSLTGSTGAGGSVAQYAGKHLKKVVLELGGSDPFIVLEDANVAAAAKAAAQSRFMNAGQSCIAAKRFIVSHAVAEEFTSRFVEEVRKLNVGNPLDPATDVGPLCRGEQRDALEAQVRDAVSKGATVLTGGKRPEGKGYFYELTVLGNVTPKMQVMIQEVFGPVAPVITVKNELQAVKMANNSEFGLGASVWTTPGRGEQLARRLEAGFVAVNRTVKSDARLPFGGIKKSGIGRELSHYGLKEFVNIKTVVVG